MTQLRILTDINMPAGLRITRAASATIPTELGVFTLHAYTNNRDNKEHLAIVRGEIENQTRVLARVHSECFTGDVLGSRRCDCGPQLEKALQRIAEANQGVILYLRQEGRGIGLIEKLKAYNLQDQGYDTVDANLMLGHGADERDYDIAAAMLTDLGVSSIRLMTNNPKKIESLHAAGIEIAERVPLETAVHDHNANYLSTKALRMNHILNVIRKPSDA